MIRTALGYLFTVEWAVYVGGALFMELVWRPLQRHVPPAQTGVLCNAMGRRYRWLALGSLGLIAATAVEHGLPVVTQDSDYDQISRAHPSVTVVKV